MTRQEREASITPKLVRSLIIVAAQRGFFEAQKTIRRELQEPNAPVALTSRGEA